MRAVRYTAHVTPYTLYGRVQHQEMSLFTELGNAFKYAHLLAAEAQLLYLLLE